MAQPWIKVWQEKILSSRNLRQCSFPASSLFLHYLIQVRADGEFMGKLCYPNGEPISDRTFWQDIKMRPRDYRIAKARLLQLGVITFDEQNRIVLRKFCELTQPYSDQSPTLRRPKSDPISTDAQPKSPSPLIYTEEIKERECATHTLKSKAHPENIVEVVEYMTERDIQNPIREAQKFWDYFESIGWVVGSKKAPMRDWKAAVRTWVGRIETTVSVKPKRTAYDVARDNAERHRREEEKKRENTQG